MRKSIAFVLIIAMTIALVLPVSAATVDPIQPRFNYINTVYAELSIDELIGVATCSGVMSSRYAKPVKIIVRLQQYRDGSWVTLRTWSATGTIGASYNGQYAVSSGYTYRASVTAYVYDADGGILETATATDSYYYS